ncbi:MAG: hypothetical protein KKF50_01410 [Nanoarchaeota archaeon]|nr:hypothetical protein [Nanoarchaeota archaeon]
MKTKVYTIGNFSGWRNELHGKLSKNFEFDDPRNHSQSSIARLVTDDMASAMNCPVSLIYTPKGKRVGTMSYAELGASWARGNFIISVDENFPSEDIISKVSDYNFENFSEATDFLNNSKWERGERMKSRDRTKSREPYRSVLFAGNLEKFSGLVGRITLKKKNSLLDPDPDYFEAVHDQVDLIIANFDGEHDPKGLFYMGVSYALKIPVIMVEGNSVPYPPLLGLARRVMVGEKRLEQLEYYLENLKSQHVSDEALVYYDLMRKFN